MKKSGKSILFFSRKREADHAGQKQKSIWNGLKFSYFSRSKKNVLLSVLPIPVLIPLFFQFGPEVALGEQENSTSRNRLSDFFEMEAEDAPIPSLPQRTTPTSAKSRYFESDGEETIAPIQDPRNQFDSNSGQFDSRRPGGQISASPQSSGANDVQRVNPQQNVSNRSDSSEIKTFQTPSGYIVQEYQKDGVLIREYATPSASAGNVNSASRQTSISNGTIPDASRSSDANVPQKSVVNVSPKEEQAVDSDSAPDQLPDSISAITAQSNESAEKNQLRVPENRSSFQNEEHPVGLNEIPDSISLEPDASVPMISENSLPDDSTTLPSEMSTGKTLPEVAPTELEASAQIPDELPSQLPSELPEKSITPPSKESAIVASEIPQRVMKRWEGTGLIPQNWNEEPLLSSPEATSNLVSPAEETTLSIPDSDLVSASLKAAPSEPIVDDFSLPEPPSEIILPEISQTLETEREATSMEPEKVPSVSSNALPNVAFSRENHDSSLTPSPFPELPEGREVAENSPALKAMAPTEENHSFDSALKAIQEPASPMEGFSAVQCVSREDVEASWTESFCEVQQANHLEAQNARPTEVSLATGRIISSPTQNVNANSDSNVSNSSDFNSGKTSPDVSGEASVKRLSAPDKARRLNKKPEKNSKNAESGKRFDFGISSGKLEEWITSGELKDETTPENTEVECEIASQTEDSLLQTMDEMRSPDILPENLLQENQENVSPAEKKKKLELFDFGIDDMAIFEGNSVQNTSEDALKPASSSKIHQEQSATKQLEKSQSSKKSETSENENTRSQNQTESFSVSTSGLVFEHEEEYEKSVSVAESVSTIASVSYESGRDEGNSIRLVQSLNPKENASEEKRTRPVRLPRAGRTPLIQAKTAEETRKASGTVSRTVSDAKTNDSQIDDAKTNDAEIEEEETDVELDFLLLSPDEFDSKSIQEQKADARNKISTNVATEEPKEKTSDGQKSEISDIPQNDAPEILEFGDSETGMTETENDLSVDVAPEEANEESVFPNEKKETDPVSENSELQAEAESVETPESFLPETKNSNEDALFPNEASSQTRNEEAHSMNSVSEEISNDVANQVADRIADQIANKVVEKTVDEVMRRLKNQLDEEMTVRSNEDNRKNPTSPRITVRQSHQSVRSDVPSRTETEGLNDELKAEISSDGKRPETKNKPDSTLNEDDSIPDQVFLTDNFVSEPSQLLNAPETAFQQQDSADVSDTSLKETVVSLAPEDQIPQTAQEVSSLDELSAPADATVSTVPSANGEKQAEKTESIPPNASSQLQSVDQGKNAPGFVKLSGRKKKKNQPVVSKPESASIAAKKHETDQRSVQPDAPANGTNLENQSPANGTSLAIRNPTNGADSVASRQSVAQNQFPQTPENNPFENQRLAEPQAPIKAPVANSVSSLAEAPIPKMNLSAELIENGKKQISPKLQQTTVADANDSAAAQNEKTDGKTFTSTDEKKEKRISVQSCAGVVLNTNSPIQSVSIQNPQFCDFVKLNETQLAIVGKSPGETEVQIAFDSDDVKPMIFMIQVQNGNESTRLLTRWSQQVEEELATVLEESDISIFQFQNRIFVKGHVSENIDPLRIIAEIQKNFVKLKKANPQMTIPGITEINRKIVLVNMLEKK